VPLLELVIYSYRINVTVYGKNLCLQNSHRHTDLLGWLFSAATQNLQLWTCEVNSVDKRHITELLLLYFLSMSHFTKKNLAHNRSKQITVNAYAK